MSSRHITRIIPGSTLSPTNRRDQREQAEAQALEEVAKARRERQRKSARLRKLRLSGKQNSAKRQD